MPARLRACAKSGPHTCVTPPQGSFGRPDTHPPPRKPQLVLDYPLAGVILSTDLLGLDDNDRALRLITQTRTQEE